MLFSKEYRTELEDYDYRLPGGKVFDSLEEYRAFLKSGDDINEAARVAAAKECREETGLEPIEMEHFYTSHAGATVQWDLHYFVVSKFEELSDGQSLEDGEVIETQWVTFQEARDLVKGSRMKEDRSIGVLWKFLLSKDVL